MGLVSISKEREREREQSKLVFRLDMRRVGIILPIFFLTYTTTLLFLASVKVKRTKKKEVSSNEFDMLHRQYSK